MVDDTQHTNQNEATNPTHAPVPAPAPTPAPPTPAKPATPPSAKSGGPVYSARPIGQNQFQIHEGDKPIGHVLTPTESATVLAWVRSVTSGE